MSIGQGESLGSRLSTSEARRKNDNCEMCKRNGKPAVHVKTDLS